MRQLIAGNWKMNGLRPRRLALAGPCAPAPPAWRCDLLVCPPFTA